MSSEVWMVGQLTSIEPVQWELNGVYTSGVRAIAACRDQHYFVFTAKVNESLKPDQNYPLDSFFPLIDGNQYNAPSAKPKFEADSLQLDNQLA